MAELPGDTLTEVLECRLGQPLTLPLFLDIAAGIAAAVDELHGRGLIHKDLKPANILVAEDGTVRLTGFGIASRLPRERAPPDPPETIAGTLAYMAPEQTGRMNRSVDSRSDLYALGVIFYRLLTGELPCSADDAMGWVHCQIAHLPTPPAQRRPEIPAAVSAIVMKLLAKAAEERYQTAAGLLADLRRCREQWQAAGQIASFAPGADDRPRELRIPERLFGRETELSCLAQACARQSEGGTPELILIGGDAGVGKSTLALELLRSLPPCGLVAAGKFDQYQRDIPYAPVAQALRTLVRQLLLKPERELEAWRTAIRTAVGASGRLVADLVPELELVIGEQPAVADVPAAEAESRHLAVLTRFLGLFARREHPLLLFLDDLQWLDAATLKFLGYLLADRNIRYLLAVGAYREAEVGPDHPLRHTLATLRAAGAAIGEIALTPLCVADLGRLIAAALHAPPERVATLTELVHDKTAGNPFFAIQFLTDLWDEGLLAFDPAANDWRWDAERIGAKDYADNVASMMAERVGRLPAAARDALGQLAYLGHQADADLLSLVRGCPARQTEADLRPALRAGFVLPENGRYRFVHDRVREAAYALLPDAERAAEHLRIGRLLLAEPQAGLFEVVGQLNRGIALIADARERDLLCELNALAGRRAKAAVATVSASRYFAQAIELLPPDAWSSRHAETFALHLARCECEYLAGRHQVADELFELLLANAGGDLERARVHRLRSRLYQATGRFADALALILDALRLSGVSLPDTAAELQAARAAEMDDVRTRLAGRSVAALADARAATDATAILLIGLLVEGLAPAYAASPPHFSLLAAKAVSCSLDRGNTPDSCQAYCAYALALIAERGDIAAAWEFSELALTLAEKFDDRRSRGLVLVGHGGLVLPRRRHIAGGRPFIEQGLAALLEAGDFLDAAYLAVLAVWAVVEQGRPLAEVVRETDRYASLTREFHNETATATVELHRQFVACLTGRTRAPGSLDDAGFSEAACLVRFGQAGWLTGSAYCHVMKQVCAYLFGDYAAAIEASNLAEPQLHRMMAMPVATTRHFFHALTLAALYGEAPAERQPALAQTLAAHCAELERWAADCPENFAGRHALAAAELARIEGRELDAERLYEQAVAGARDNGFLQIEALAFERAADFYRGRGFDTIAAAYLRRARHAYLRWGATGKVHALEARHPDLAEAPRSRGDAVIGSPVAQLDAVAVAKASQAISGEIVPERLIETLLRIALEHAGAERVLLLLPQDEDWHIAAQASAGGERVAVTIAAGTRPSAPALPESLLRYVLRTRETVLLDDAAAPNLFSADAYLAAKAPGERPRSVLCVPLQKQAALVGALYLENRLTPHAFTPARIAVLELLASQAAISLENARYCVALQSEIAERRRAEEALAASRARFSAILASALEGIVTVDERQRIVYINPAAERLFGWTTDEAIGMPLDRLIPARFRAPHRAHVHKFADNGETRRVMGTPMEVYGLRRNGEEFAVDAAISRVDSGGQMLMTVMLRDASDRKRAEQELRLYREHLEELVAQRTAELTTLQERLAIELADLKRLHGLSTRLLAASEPAPLLHEVLQASIELLGADKGKLQLYDKRDNVLRLAAQIGFDQVFVDAFAAVPPFSAICGTALGTRERVIVEDCRTDPRFTEDRALYAANDVVAMQSTPLYGGDGQLCGVLTTHFRAIHRPSERELRLLDLYAQQATRVIENSERSEQLQEARRKAEEADRAKSVFLTTMSHELRTPLNAILGYAQVLARAPSLGERQAEGLATIRQSGEYLLALINDILDLSKIEAGRFELNRGPANLPLLLQIVAETIAVRAEQKGLRFSFEAAPDLPAAVTFDERRVRQVLLNLLGNAVKFTERGGVTLRVGSQPVEGGEVRLRFEIEDTGAGIRADQLETIFQPFEQVGAAQSRLGGTGLGLAISRQLVRLMASEIHAESEPGRGSRFWFDLAVPPALEAQPAPPAERAVTGSEVPPSPDAGARPLLAPQPDEMEILRQLALTGNMRAIRQRSDHLKAIDPRYGPFADRLRDLARRYQSQAILALVNHYLKESDE